MSEKRTVRPFSTGSQYMDWEAKNCDGCDLRHRCSILRALAFACIDDGTITATMATRMGADRSGNRYAWPCPERSPQFSNQASEYPEFSETTPPKRPRKPQPMPLFDSPAFA